MPTQQKRVNAYMNKSMFIPTGQNMFMLTKHKHVNAYTTNVRVCLNEQKQVYAYRTKHVYAYMNKSMIMPT
jgi:hypothetical protein